MKIDKLLEALEYAKEQGKTEVVLVDRDGWGTSQIDVQVKRGIHNQDMVFLRQRKIGE